jgi:uncharacterized membrane protein YqjE
VIIPGKLTPISIPSEGKTRPAAPDVDPVPSSAFMQNLAAPILKCIEARAFLLGIETREALQQTVALITWLLLGAIATFAGWLLLASSLVGAISKNLSWSWVTASAVVGAVHILIALIAAWVVRNRFTTARWFQDSVNEFTKDRAWLKNQTTKN